MKKIQGFCPLLIPNMKTKILLVPNSCETLLSSVSKKDNAIKDLEEKCLTFESRVLSLEQEDDSLRHVITIIMQEKSESSALGCLNSVIVYCS